MPSMLEINDLHSAFQSQPFYGAISAILAAKMAEITVQYS